METPEGVEFALSAAGLVARGLAFIIDWSIRGMVYLFGSIALLFWLGEAAPGPIAILLFLGEWFYPVLFEVRWRGQTPGKAGIGLRVVHADGTPVRLTASLLRNLLLAADFLPFAYGFGIASMASTRGFRRLGDLAAGTLVVYVPAARGAHPEPPEVSPEPPALALTTDEQRAVVAYAERAASLAPERADELAALAAPLGGTRRGLEAVAAHLLRGSSGTSP